MHFTLLTGGPGTHGQGSIERQLHFFTFCWTALSLWIKELVSRSIDLLSSLVALPVQKKIILHIIHVRTCIRSIGTVSKVKHTRGPWWQAQLRGAILETLCRAHRRILLQFYVHASNSTCTSMFLII